MLEIYNHYIYPKKKLEIKEMHKHHKRRRIQERKVTMRSVPKPKETCIIFLFFKEYIIFIITFFYEKYLFIIT